MRFTWLNKRWKIIFPCVCVCVSLVFYCVNCWRKKRGKCFVLFFINCYFFIFPQQEIIWWRSRLGAGNFSTSQQASAWSEAGGRLVRTGESSIKTSSQHGATERSTEGRKRWNIRREMEWCGGSRCDSTSAHLQTPPPSGTSARTYAYVFGPAAVPALLHQLCLTDDSSEHQWLRLRPPLDTLQPLDRPDPAGHVFIHGPGHLHGRGGVLCVQWLLAWR